MATYPDLPYNRLIVNGVDLSTRFRMVLADGYTLGLPEPKSYTVDIPGSDGALDLSEYLSGDITYSNRTDEFTFYIIDVTDDTEIERIKTDFYNFLHGRSYDYKLSFDPDYTRHGRFSVTEVSHSAYSSGLLVGFNVSIDADPYKLKETKTYRLNGTGGKLFTFESGRKRVRPTIECSSTIFVNWKGKEIIVPAGTYRLDEVVFEQGNNELYINTLRLYRIVWDDLSETGNYPRTWADVASLRWDDLQKIDLDYEAYPQCWSDVSNKTWAELAEKTWNDVDYREAEAGDSTAYIQYDWKDL